MELVGLPSRPAAPPGGGGAPGASCCVLDLRIHQAERLPRPLGQVMVAVDVAGAQHRTAAIPMADGAGGLAAFQAWGRIWLPEGIGDGCVSFKVRPCATGSVAGVTPQPPARSSVHCAVGGGGAAGGALRRRSQRLVKPSSELRTPDPPPPPA